MALWLEEPTLTVVSFSDQDSCGRNWRAGGMTPSEAQGFALFPKAQLILLLKDFPKPNKAQGKRMLRESP